MLFLTCQTFLTHSFVPQHVLNTSFIVYRTPHNMTQCILSISFLSCKTPAACYTDRNALWPYCLPAVETSKGCPLLWKPSLNLSFLLAACRNTLSFPCKVPPTCSFSVQNVVRMHFQRALNMLFLVCEMLHNMKILEYVSQHVVSFRQSASNM